MYSNANSYWGQGCFNFISVLGFLNHSIHFLDEDFPQLCQTLFHLANEDIFKRIKFSWKTKKTQSLHVNQYWYFNAAKCNLMELTTNSGRVFPWLLALVLNDLCIHQDSTCSWTETCWQLLQWALFCMGAPLEAFHLHSLPLSTLLIQCDSCLSPLILHQGSWLGFQDLPAMGAVFI